MAEFTLYTDGGCHGNPGPGGWAYLIEYDSKTIENNGGEPQTTNNRMELTAVIRGLERIAEKREEVPLRVTVYTDSEYVKNGITTWIHNWLKNGWKTSGRKPVKNRDLWIRLHELSQEFEIDWQWLRGHSGHQGNERCDTLVQEAILEFE